MIPKRVTLENFLSFGPAPATEIEFADDEPLWIVGGANGVGKSAIFDAITFCLYGTHRGDGNEVAPLVRHGANGFTVGIEFEFNGIDYKVVRGRSGNRPVQSVQHRVDGDWQRVPDQIANARDVTAWTERTLGLEAETFEASVLLRQGQADKVVSAKPKQRLEFLKSVLGMGEYEELGGRVREAQRKSNAARDALAVKRAPLPDVTPEEIAEAAAVREVADIAHNAADQKVSAAAELVQQSRQFQSIENERRELKDKLAEADARAADAEAIRRDHGRFVELTSVLTTLEKLIPLRDGLPAIERQRDEAAEVLHSTVAQQFETARQIEGHKLAAASHREKAADLAAEINRLKAEKLGLEREIQHAEALALIDAEIAKFQPELDEKHAAAGIAYDDAVGVERTRSDEFTEAKTLLKQREKERAEFEGVEEGQCSRCGLIVGTKHLAQERARLDELIRELTDRTIAAESGAREAKAAVVSSSQTRKSLGERLQQRDTLTAKRQGQAAHGGSADVARLKETLREQSDGIAAREKAHAAEREKQIEAENAGKRLTATHADLTIDVEKNGKRATEIDRKASTDRASVELLAGQLPDDWAATTALDLIHMREEHRTLTTERVADRFAELQQDFAQRDVWAGRLAQLKMECDAIPPAARVPINEAELAHAQAVVLRKQADTEYERARDTFADLQRKAEELAKVVADLAEAERVARVHDKLDRLLGNAGLQRELVRRAETAIVRYANETAGKLSDGELTVSLAGESDGDKALDLLVRVGDDPTPTPVAYLSGSQRFRVAVAVALGIGRFASHGAKPLECVIIDEGFGSLDRDGLRAAAEELTRLRGSLKRIILVSHQDDFTDRFPVMIRLSKGENGTVAEKIRR